MAGRHPYFWTSPPPFPGCYVRVSWGTKSRSCVGIIDTGADQTFIPSSITKELHLRKIDDSVDVDGPDSPNEPQDEYIANLSFLGLDIPNWPVISNDKWNEILIGRDIINDWLLTLDGPNGYFTID
jgi:hypothetical protein